MPTHHKRHHKHHFAVPGPSSLPSSPSPSPSDITISPTATIGAQPVSNDSLGGGTGSAAAAAADVGLAVVAVGGVTYYILRRKRGVR